MSRFFSEKYERLTPYTPGEQPQNRKYIKLNTNESPFPPSPKACEAAGAAARDLQLYSDPECLALRQKAAQLYHVSEDEVMFTNGSDEALNFAFMAFCDQRHPAAFPDITYGFYKVFARLNGVDCEEIPLDEFFRVNADDYCGIHKTVFLANPNAPSGLALSKQEIERILQTNPQNVVVIDEAYVDFYGESCVDLIHRYDNLLVLQTFSKSRSLAGGRLGVCFAQKPLIDDLNTLRFSTNPYNVNRMTMAAGLAALEDEAYFEQNCRTIRRVREETKDALRDLGFTMTDSQANFLFIRHADIPGEKLYLALKEQGVLVRHFNEPRLRDYNRVTVGSEDQMRAFLSILKSVMEEF